ncbi:MAG: hypothetical protein QOE96_3174, partial [Blastocatellia bacterium]|nr:hypothetical protein [Blastocatellia bacterium]
DYTVPLRPEVDRLTRLLPQAVLYLARCAAVLT